MSHHGFVRIITAAQRDSVNSLVTAKEDIRPTNWTLRYVTEEEVFPEEFSGTHRVSEAARAQVATSVAFTAQWAD